MKPKNRVKAPSSIFRLFLAALPPFTLAIARTPLLSISGEALLAPAFPTEAGSVWECGWGRMKGRGLPIFRPVRCRKPGRLSS